MSKKFYLGALVFPLILTGCSDDMLTENNGQQNDVYANGKVISLDSNFRLFAGRTGSGDASTRGEWITGNGTHFYWMPKGALADVATGLSGTQYKIDALPAVDENLKFDEVGLCWVGESNTPGDKIYTNYLFTHDGWMEAEERSMEEIVKECVDGEYKYTWNYVKYEDVVNKGLSVNNLEKVVEGVFDTEVDAFTTGMSEVNQKKIKNVNLGSGTFKTENKSIFSGNYIAYYPYDSKMVQQDALTVTGAIVQEFIPGKDNRAMSAGKYTFAAGYMPEPIKGGSAASALAMRPITGLGILKIAQSEISNGKIKHIILLDSKGGLRKSFKVKPSAIAAAMGQKAEAATQTILNGIVPGSEKNTNVVKVDVTGEGLTTEGYTVTSTESEPVVVVVPLLPTEKIADLDVLLVKEDGTVRIATVNGKQVKSGYNNVLLEEDRSFADFNKYVAWDETSLSVAVGKKDNKEVLLLGDVYVTNKVKVEKMTVTGEWRKAKVGKLIIAGSDTRRSFGNVEFNNATAACDILVEAQGCCHTGFGHLMGIGMTYEKGTYADGSVNTITNNGWVSFQTTENRKDANLLTENNIYGNIINEPLRYVGNGQTDAYGNEYLLSFETAASRGANDAPTIPGEGKIYISSLVSVNLYGNLENRTTTTENGGRRVDGIISLDKRDKGQFPNNNMDARLIIAYKNNVSGKLTNAGTIENRGTVANNSGNKVNLKNEVHATFVNMIGGQLNGYMMDKEANSNVIAEVDNSIDSRFATALNDHLTNIIKFVESSEYADNNQKYVYALDKVGERKDLKFIVDCATAVFTGEKYIDGDAAMDRATIGALELTEKAANVSINAQDNILFGVKMNPVSLFVDNTEYNKTHIKVDDVLVNEKYPVDIKAVRTKAGSKMNMKSFNNAVDGVELNVKGDVLTEGTVDFGLNVDTYVNTPKLIVDGNVTLGNECIFTFDKAVTESKILGNLSIGTAARINFNADVKLKVGENNDITEGGEIMNRGVFNIESQAITSSPAVVYCKKYNLEGGTWLNGGRPTPFTAGGVQPEDYNW